MSITKRIVMTIDAIAESLERASAFEQETKEKETIAHMRDERHNKKFCAICIATEEAAEYEVQDCKKHDFGECKANCRYRTGIVEDCTWHSLDCDADCKWRKSHV
jgi:hypothetical protein